MINLVLFLLFPNNYLYMILWVMVSWLFFWNNLTFAAGVQWPIHLKVVSLHIDYFLEDICLINTDTPMRYCWVLTQDNLELISVPQTGIAWICPAVATLATTIPLGWRWCLVQQWSPIVAFPLHAAPVTLFMSPNRQMFTWMNMWVFMQPSSQMCWQCTLVQVICYLHCRNRYPHGRPGWCSSLDPLALLTPYSSASHPPLLLQSPFSGNNGVVISVSSWNSTIFYTYVICRDAECYGIGSL